MFASVGMMLDTKQRAHETKELDRDLYIDVDETEHARVRPVLSCRKSESVVRPKSRKEQRTKNIYDDGKALQQPYSGK